VVIALNRLNRERESGRVFQVDCEVFGRLGREGRGVWGVECLRAEAGARGLRAATMTLAIPYFVALATYLSYAMLFVFGHLRDFFRGLFGTNKPPKVRCASLVDVARGLNGLIQNWQGLAPLCRDFEDFYTRRLYHRIQDCWNRPISSAPDAWIDVEERDSNDRNKTLFRTGKTRHCLNVGSYNYLGFAAADEYCTERVITAVGKYGPCAAGPRMEAATTDKHLELEKLVARFVGKPAAMLFGMGFATNSASLPAIIGKVRGMTPFCMRE
jgi:serine palmitoyltransferase